MKHLTTIGASVFAALGLVAGSAVAQSPSAGPPHPPAAAMPAAKPAPAAAMKHAGATKSAAAKPTAAVKPTAAAKTSATTTSAAAAKPAAGAPAVAAAPAPVAPKPAPELAQLKLFEGSWRCEGKQPAGPFGPEQVYKSSFKGKKDVQNFWLAIEYTQRKSKAHPLPILAKGYLGYDPATKKFVNMGVDNMGGSVTETSPGWEGDKLTFTGEGQMGGQNVSFRETYTKAGDKQLVWSGEMKMGKDWIPVGTDTCKK